MKLLLIALLRSHKE